MPLAIPYEGHQKEVREPTLEVAEGSVSISLPPTPRWLELSVIAFDCACSAVWVVMFGLSLRMTIQIRTAIPSFPSRGWMALIVCAGLLGVGFLFFTLHLIVRIKQPPVPRRIQISRGLLWHSYRGEWRIKSRGYPLSEITSIRLKTIKGLLGRPAGAVLIIGIGRWRKLRMRFGRKWMALAADAEQEFRRAIESSPRE